MTVAALIMAGGAGERMQRAGLPKPLVRVRGASLLERNVCAAIGSGITQIWIACGDGQQAIRREIDRLAGAASGRGVVLQALLERQPLGTVGAAGLLHGRAELVVTSNADNLTTLEPSALIAHHRTTGADLTLATHDHTVRLPYGAVDCAGERVTAYREKPASVTRIASAVCVLGPAAIAVIAGVGDATVAATQLPGRLGLPELTTQLIAAGRRVIAHHHAAPWIDVNEPADLARASALIVANAERFERWAAEPEREVAGAIVVDHGDLLLERRRDSGLWDTPGGKLEPGESADEAIVRELVEELGVRVLAGRQLACFDTLEPDGSAVRHHVFAPAAARAQIAPHEGQTLGWFPIDRLPGERSPVVDRSLAAMERTDA